MSKFSGRNITPVRPRGPVTTTATPAPVRTAEGGAGQHRDPESELFVLAAANFVGEDTFYERAGARDSRFRALVEAVTKTNPAFIAGAKGRMGLAEFLRSVLQMRSAPIVMAAEYIAAGGPGGRDLVRRVCQRADEPAEVLGYWLSTRGRRFPAALKRGVADAAVKLYTQRSALRYDGLSRSIRMADVIELTHPAPVGEEQSALFAYLLDRRHHPDAVRASLERLPVLAMDQRLMAMPEAGRRVALREGLVAEAGWSWERLSGWLPGGMDAEAWEAVIPQMGYMALIRNLRNFDEAGVSAAAKAAVRNRLASPAEVAASRQFPYRFWSAYKFAPSLEWAATLESALELATANIPALPGRSLILIDISGSMAQAVSDRSQVRRFEVGALFAAAQAKKADNADVVLFATGAVRCPVAPSASVLRYVETVGAQLGRIGYGTNIHAAMADHWNGHDRVVVFTDEAGRDSYRPELDKIGAIHMVNLAGYQAAAMESGPGRYTWAGFTDAMFTLMGLVEAGRDQDWPF